MDDGGSCFGEFEHEKAVRFLRGSVAGADRLLSCRRACRYVLRATGHGEFTPINLSCHDKTCC